MKVRKKPMILDAEYAAGDGIMQTPEGVMNYAEGDVLMTGAYGERYPIKREIFDKTYDILDEDISA